MRQAWLVAALALVGGPRPALGDRDRQVVIKSCVYPIRTVVHFERGSARLADEARPVLQEIASTMKAHPDLRRVQVEGHTDNAETSGKQALALSERRARAVRDALVALGVAEGRLVVTGSGSSKPIAPNQTEAGRALNRRVEFTVLDAQGAP